jgi:phenylalanyl-tRNA synthetase beta chain
MKIPYQWLKDFLPTSASVETVADILTLAGLEVDGVLGTSFRFKGVITAKVESVIKHPDSDRLQIASLNTGKETLQIVCGASNCRAGLITALAPIGSSLHPLKGSVITIQKTLIRKVESYGMLCSKEELGLEESSSEILELADSTLLGIPLEELFLDPVFEISLTPNLGHCFSVLGVARELSYPSKESLILPTLSKKIQTVSTHSISIEIESSQCEEFHLASIKNVKIGPSLPWMQDRLKLCGMKPINNVVDAINYVMHELGQPMHAYDYDKLNSKKIIVKEAPHGIPFIGLDAVARQIPNQTLLITSDGETIAAAGVIGSHETMVTEQTKHILIEAAHFNPKKIRQSMRLLGLRTEAGAHFEKGIDRQMIKTALFKVCELIQESIEDHSIIEYSHVEKTPYQKKVISLRCNRVNQLIGIHLSENEIEILLKKIGCKIDFKKEGILSIEVPSYRNDINEEIDLVEEVARIYGFNHIEKSSGFYRRGTIDDSPIFSFEMKVKEALFSLGLQEIITCNLISPKQAENCLTKDFKSSQLITMLHAKSVDQSILRPSFFPTFLQVIKHNLNFNTKSIKAFEVGRVHFYNEGKAEEKFAIGILLTGKEKEHFALKSNPYDFFDLKGIIETLLEILGVDYEIVLSESNLLHPGQQAKILSQNEELGYLGKIHPTHAKNGDVEVPVYFAQLDLLQLMKLSTKIKKMTKLSEFPSSTRDVTLTLNKITTYSKLLTTIESVHLNILKQVECLDIFTSAALGSHHHNLTLRFTYRSDEKTLDFETIEKGHQEIMQALMPLTESVI